MSSVYINFDPNFNNSKAYDFSTNYDDQLKIPANSEVALYSAHLEKAPIYLNQPNSITIQAETETITAYKNGQDFNASTSYNNLSTIDDITVNFKAQESYTKQEFIDTVCDTINSAIATRDGAASKSKYNYKFVGRNDKDSIFMNLAPNFIQYPLLEHGGGARLESDAFKRNISYHLDDDNVSSNITATAIDTSDKFKTWTIGQSAINVLDKFNTDNSSLYFSILDNSTAANTTKFFVGFSEPEDLFANLQDGNSELLTVKTQDFTMDVPQCRLGILINYDNQTDENSSITIVENTYLGTVRTGEYGDMIIVYHESELKIDPTTKFKVSFKYENNTNSLDLRNNKFYYIVDFNDSSGNNNSIDSRRYGHYINRFNIINNYNQEVTGATDTNQYYTGLVPFFSLASMDATATMLGFNDIRGNWVNQQVVPDVQAGTIRDMPGILKYKITFSDEFAQIFGNNTFSLVPAHSENNTEEVNLGLRNLFVNERPINLEITNLPIKSYSNTLDNIGTRRAILYQINNLFRGSLNNINQNKLNRTLYVEQMKYLKLRNEHEIKLNKLDIKLVYADTNEEVKGIEKANFEILIK